MHQKYHHTVSLRRLFAAITIALALFGHAVSAADDSAIQTATTALQRGDLPAAEAALAPLTGANAHPGALALLAQVRLRQHRALDATMLLEQAVSVDKGNASLHAALGRALSEYMPDATMDEIGSVATRMLTAFQTAIAIDPNMIEARVGLARYYTQAPEVAGGSRARAEEQARAIAQRVPWLGDAELGQIALHFGDFAMAAELLAKADAQKPGQAWLLELRGQAAARSGDLAQARAHFQAALALDANLASARDALERLPKPSESQPGHP